MKINNHALLLVAITIAALVLRFNNLCFTPLWLDEAATLFYSSSGYVGVWNYVLSGEYNPPLFYWITTFMLSFGNSEFVLRFVPACVGVLTIPAVYYLGREWRSSTIGLAGSALLAFSPFHIYYSQEARAYSLVVFFVVLMLYAFLRATKENSYKWWILTAAFGALAFWTHFYAMMIVFAVFLYALWNSEFKKETLKRVLVAGVAFVWMILPLALATYYLLKLRTREAPTFGLKGQAIILDLLKSYGGYIDWLSLVMVCLFAAGLWLVYKKDHGKGTFALFVTLFVVGLTIPLSYYIPMVARYMLFLLPLYLLIISEPLTYFKDDRIKAICVIGLIAMAAPTLYTQTTVYTKDDWRGFGTFLSERTNDGDVVITSPSYMDLILNYYYNNTTDKTTMKRADNITSLEQYTEPGKTWYVMTPDVGAVVDARTIPQWLDTNATAIAHWQYYIYLYHK